MKVCRDSPNRQQMKISFITLLVAGFLSTALCFVPMRLSSAGRSRDIGLCLKQSVDELWNVIKDTRLQRDRIKEEIVQVVELQRGCDESSEVYLALERRFMDLIDMEDETVLRISRLVHALVSKSRLDRNGTALYRSYFSDV